MALLFAHRHALVVLLLSALFSSVAAQSTPSPSPACSSAASCCDITGGVLTCAGCCANTTALDLQDKGITTVPAGVFDNLTAVQSIYLTNNPFISLPACLFCKNFALEWLELGQKNTRGSRLRSLPDFLFPPTGSALQHLDIGSGSDWSEAGGGATLGFLNASTFANLTQLLYLRLFNAGVTGFDPASFCSMRALTYLDMSYNNIAFFPPGLFDNLTAVRTIRLPDNPFTSLPACLFCKNLALEHLSLGYHYSVYGSLLTSLPDHLFPPAGSSLKHLEFNRGFEGPGASLGFLKASTFENLTSLTFLGFERAGVTGFEPRTFSSMRQLNSLDLSACSLTVLPTEAFTGLTSLTALSLRNNSLTTDGLDGDIFAPLTSLQILDLSQNRLSSVSSCWLQPLTSLSVASFMNNAFLTSLPPNLCSPTIASTAVYFDNTAVLNASCSQYFSSIASMPSFCFNASASRDSEAVM